MRVLGIAMVLTVFLVSIAQASDILLVGVKPAPPFVIVDEKTGALSGFSIDLMDELARTLEPPRKVKYQIDPDLASHLDTVRSGKVDLGIAATTITAEREKSLDFSHPFYRSGLGILVSTKRGSGGFWRILLSPGFRIVLFSVAIYVLICAILIWLAERGSASFNDRWLPGLLQGIWWTIVTMSTVGYGDFVPRKVLGRILGVIVIFSGIALFGWAIAFLSSSLTVHQLESDISGPNDLVGRKVAVISGTIGAEVMERMQAQVSKFNTLEEATTALEQGDLIAVVHDIPLLQYYNKTEGKGRFMLVGGIFEPANYGIVFPPGNPLREEINIALLKLMEGESSPYNRLQQKWFGAVEEEYIPEQP
ncbi:MAG TPA: transporter substrate-binding domain-containing protein [Candidatus Omnitrophica bacterium]|nr:transporter substrate-binding domain-containing protein [Candidatus Omnitrophota bacterium]